MKAHKKVFMTIISKVVVVLAKVPISKFPLLFCSVVFQLLRMDRMEQEVQHVECQISKVWHFLTDAPSRPFTVFCYTSFALYCYLREAMLRMS